MPVPFNLLLTADWLWLVPRRQAACEGIGVNALGFAGALLVRGEQDFERLAALGPMRVLREVAGR
jgi:sulfate adenylyltransferase (ADP) / ATP adenylyltransferase